MRVLSDLPGLPFPKVSLPDLPAPVQVEIELTGHCNADCVACPRDTTKENMTPAMLGEILDRYKDYRHPVSGKRVKIIFAGGGEPFFNKHAPEMIRMVKQRGFRLTVITNASLLHLDRIDLPDVLGHVDEFLISFWGIREQEYMNAMRFRKEGQFDISLNNVREVVRLHREMAPRFHMAVQWLDNPFITSLPEEIESFWWSEGVYDVRNGGLRTRGGQIQENKFGDVDEYLARSGSSLPDFSRAVWCADLFSSHAYDSRGDLRLCCCGYFSQGSEPVFRREEIDSVMKIVLKQQEILDRKDSRPECRECRLRRGSRASALFPYLDRLEEGARAMLTEYPAASPPMR